MHYKFIKKHKGEYNVYLHRLWYDFCSYCPLCHPDDTDIDEQLIDDENEVGSVADD